jgi:hypothetical protein
MPFTPPSQRIPSFDSPANLLPNFEQGQQAARSFQEATEFTNLNPTSPCLAILIECAERLAAIALDTWEAMCLEIECQREVFKFCCGAQGTFAAEVFQSYVNRVRLMHNSLKCGLLVSLRTMLDQIRVWFQVATTTSNAEESFLSGVTCQFGDFPRLVGVMQQLEFRIDAVQFPDAVSLSQDASIIQERYWQEHGYGSQSSASGNGLGDQEMNQVGISDMTGPLDIFQPSSRGEGSAIDWPAQEGSQNDGDHVAADPFALTEQQDSVGEGSLQGVQPEALGKQSEQQQGQPALGQS